MKPKEMLMAFSRYGVRKTSMEDIARAAGVSRQSIYKRFGSKDRVLEWVLTSFIEEIVEAATEALRNADARNPKQAVLEVFGSWSGDLAPIIGTTPHGGEILNTGMKFAADAETDWEGDLMSKLSDFLFESGLADSRNLATEQANALNRASKGIMLKSKSKVDFTREMDRVVQVILRD